jgi:hypothetical protein
MQPSDVVRMRGWRRAAFGATSIALLASLVMFTGTPATASPDLRTYANTLVHRVGDTSSPKPSWFVTSDLRRLYVNDAPTYACFRKRGVVDRGPVSADVLLTLQDQIRLRAPCGATMRLKSELRKGMFLRSPDGRCKLILQGDGNLVLYGGSRALWSTGQFDTTHAVFEPDGNFVTYRADNTPTWSANIRLKGGERLVVQNDGNLVIYAATHAVWSSGTHV